MDKHYEAKVQCGTGEQLQMYECFVSGNIYTPPNFFNLIFKTKDEESTRGNKKAGTRLLKV